MECNSKLQQKIYLAKKCFQRDLCLYIYTKYLEKKYKENTNFVQEPSALFQTLFSIQHTRKENIKKNTISYKQSSALFQSTLKNLLAVSNRRSESFLKDPPLALSVDNILVIFVPVIYNGGLRITDPRGGVRGCHRGEAQERAEERSQATCKAQSWYSPLLIRFPSYSPSLSCERCIYVTRRTLRRNRRRHPSYS